ncbi:type I restriction/modification system, specificity subunit [Arcobacter acticola]|uniref:Type I restriction/modification system, specificity subunit n=1 Tax=Arcobacter acticola TaxID=1849015 RepID=A0A6M8EDE3_9BACT|nr:restriction endonuclease subunit S [Arcobacter acticola]QKE28540.1 type I restriction/modification system, specificity subunit [Arcobacter acticola]
MSILMKDSGVQWIGDIPENWKVKVLKRVLAEPLKYGANEAAEFENTDHPRYIRITDFGNDGLLKDDTFKSLEPQIAEPYLLNEGDVLFARSGATVGKTFQFKNYKGKACFAGYLIKANPQNYLISSDFLYYFTKSPAYDTWKESIFTQATIQNIGADKYAYLPVVVPSIKIQKRITDFLDKATLQIDDAIKTKEKQLKTLEALKKSIIHKAVTKGLDDSVEMIDSKIEWIGDIPKSWRVEKLKYIGKSIIGLTYSPNDVTDKENGIHVLRSSNIQNGKMDFGNNVYVDKKIPENLITQKGDILICSRNGSRKLIGKNILIDESNCNCTFGAFMTIFRSNMNKYLYFIFNSTLFSHQAGSFMTSTINQLTINAINNMKVPIPPKDEQKNIIDYLTIEVEKINTLKENVKKQIDKLKEYKKSLIYEYVTGKKQIKG